jgi:hypothetical protein
MSVDQSNLTADRALDKHPDCLTGSCLGLPSSSMGRLVAAGLLATALDPERAVRLGAELVAG